jgi:dephospho-CoA kinase
MLKVGLTGGLGSGKSTVGAMLADLGAAVFDADDIVHDLYRPGGPGTAAVVELFGQSALAPDGSVDRQAVARRVFSDRRARQRLEAAIHPLVRRQIEERFGRAQREGREVAVAEAPLIFESGLEREFDRILLVVAPDELRRRRLESRGMDPEESSRRIAAQIHPSRARELAHDVIENADGPEELQKAVEALWDRWKSLG